MKSLKPHALLLTLFLLVIGAPGSAAALSLVEIIPGGTNDNPQDLADNYEAIDDVTDITLVENSFGGCNFGSDTSCDIDLSGLDASFLTVKANGFEALYAVAPGDSIVTLDPSTWDDDLSVPGASAYAAKWPNDSGNYPAISNIRAWGGEGKDPEVPGTPVPEPSAALVFAVGSLVTRAAVRRQRPSGAKRA